MKSFRATITLEIDDFESLSKDDAEILLNSYIDSLARTSDDRLNWFSLDYEIDELTDFKVIYDYAEQHTQKVNNYDEAKALAERLNNGGYENVFISGE